MDQSLIVSPEATNYLLTGLFSVLGIVGGSYVIFVIKAIGKDIKALKELLMTHVEGIKSDVASIRHDIQMLYELHRSNEKDIASHKVAISGIKDECAQRRSEHNNCGV